jgi:hypothetical protein
MPDPIWRTESVAQSRVFIASIPRSPSTLSASRRKPRSRSDPGDELTQTASFSDGLRQLIASKNPRKAIILATPVDTRRVPAAIQVVQADPAKLLEAAIQVRNQYLLRFQSSVPAARVEVILNRPDGLPILKVFGRNSSRAVQSRRFRPTKDNAACRSSCSNADAMRSISALVRPSFAASFRHFATACPTCAAI